jgi:hypothetical protein
MATESDAKGSDARPGPLTPAARRRAPASAPDRPVRAPDPPVRAPDPPVPAWNLSDELLGLEAGAQHVDVYGKPNAAAPATRRSPGATPAARPALRLPRVLERRAAAAISIGLATLALLLQLA